MGADMLIQSIGFKTKDHFLLDEEWARSAFERARRSVNAIDTARLAEINADQGTAYEDIASYKLDLTNDLAEVEAAVLGSHRQITTVAGGKGIILFVSGGLSWGDPPTELFGSMSRLLEAEVLPDARWPEPARSNKQSTS